MARSGKYYVGTIAALPVSYMVAKTRTTTQILLPVGMLAGIVLALLTLYLARLQMAMPAVIRITIGTASAPLVSVKLPATPMAGYSRPSIAPSSIGRIEPSTHPE